MSLVKCWVKSRNERTSSSKFIDIKGGVDCTAGGVGRNYLISL